MYGARIRRTISRTTPRRDVSPFPTGRSKERKSVGLHKLAGSRKGLWAMTVNGPWRICFRFADGDAWDVEIVDYH